LKKDKAMDFTAYGAILGIAALGVGGTALFRFWRQRRNGVWAAGYWWSDRDRRMGPG
jgi:hypothetical protein